ncbi:tetratricopeptide repeat protein, partial [Acinetobacter baumannii]
EQRRIDEAREVYKQALAMRDDLVWAKIGLARCNIVAGQMDDARVIVQDVLAQNKQFIAAYDLMAQIDEAQGNQEGALEALTKSS